MASRSYIVEAMDRPTVLYILYTMVSAQQTNLLPKNASRNDAIFAQKVYQIYATTSQYLSSYGCAITMVYIYIYIYIRVCNNIKVTPEANKCVSPTSIGQFTSHDMSHDECTMMSSLHPRPPPLRVMKSTPSQPLKAIIHDTSEHSLRNDSKVIPVNM